MILGEEFNVRWYRRDDKGSTGRHGLWIMTDPGDLRSHRGVFIHGDRDEFQEPGPDLEGLADTYVEVSPDWVLDELSDYPEMLSEMVAIFERHRKYCKMPDSPVEKLTEACQLVSEVGGDVDDFVTDILKRYVVAEHGWNAGDIEMRYWTIGPDGLVVSWEDTHDDGETDIPAKYVCNPGSIEGLARENRQKQLEADERRKEAAAQEEKHNAQQRENYDRKEYERLKLKYKGTSK